MPENPLTEIIRQQIRAHEPMPVADYMQLALQHSEHGYYIRRDPLGAPGDFITAPEISQIFGELIGVWLAEQWRLMGKPAAILTELGPGRGTLMSDALRATKNIPGFHEAVSVHLVETSPALKEKQWQALAGSHPRIEWHMAIDTLPQQPLLLVANEFFDALPVRQFILSPGGEWKERMIDVDDKEHLHFIVNTVTQAPPTLPSPSRGEGIFERCEAGVHIMRAIAAHIATHGGAALAVDYGYEGPKAGDTLQAVREHRYHDVLDAPGTADITAHVDFAALADGARSAGAAAYLTTQGAFLNRIGADVRMQQLCAKATSAQKSAMLSAYARLTSAGQMGELFKAMCVVRPGHSKPEGF